MIGQDLERLRARRAEGGNCAAPKAYWHDGPNSTSDPWGSHMPVLAALAPSCEFFVETGGGMYSTPLLCATGATVRTIETDAEWAGCCGPLTPDHRIIVVPAGDLVIVPNTVLRMEHIRMDEDDTLLFIDHGPREEDRVPVLLCEAARRARFIVLHDAEHPAFAGVDWGRWKHAVMVKNHATVWTAVVSDHADPMPFLRHLPGAERA